MSRYLGFVGRGGLGIAVVMVAMSAAFADASDNVKDAVTTARIETMFLMNGDLNPFKINTTTKDGVVTLTGVVHEQFDKDLAGRLAKTVKGVTDVQNELTIQRNAEVAKENTEWRGQVENASLHTRVRRQLAYNTSTKSAHVDIDTQGSTVIVSGDVPTKDQKDAVERVINDTAGVGKVDSKITVSANNSKTVLAENKTDTTAEVKEKAKEVKDEAKEKATEIKTEVKEKAETVAEDVTDEWVEKMVESSIAWNKNLSMRSIDVEVDHGVCKLTGEVFTDAQKSLAANIAKTTDGVKSVTNDITVSKVAAG